LQRTAADTLQRVRVDASVGPFPEGEFRQHGRQGHGGAVAAATPPAAAAAKDVPNLIRAVSEKFGWIRTGRFRWARFP